MYDAVDCQKVSETRNSLAVVVVEENSKEDLISTHWIHCVNSSNHSMMPSQSLIPFVGFPDKMLGNVHILDLGFWIG